MHRFLPFLLAAGALIAPSVATAHCDSMDGPVVADARLALASGNVTPVLKWIPAEAEAEVKADFAQTLKVRALGAEAADLADTYFFETLVRIHRAGEGEPYTGLKPAGHIDPVLVRADAALASGSADALTEAIVAHVREGIGVRFAAAVAARARAESSVAAGREFVAAYVTFMHHLEALHRLAVDMPETPACGQAE